MGYKEIRQTCLEANQRVKDIIPCAKGGGECCFGDQINLTQGDMDIIKDGVKRRKIPISVVERALQNNKLPSCPLLGDENECLLYDQRPLVCIQHGFGGELRIPKNEAEARNIGSGGSVPVNNLQTLAACITCAVEMQLKNTRIPLTCISASNEASRFVALNKVTTIREFVANDLAKLV